MRVKMLTLSIGPDHHYEAGDIIAVDSATGDALASLGYAEIIQEEVMKRDAVDAQNGDGDGTRITKPRKRKSKTA